MTGGKGAGKEKKGCTLCKRVSSFLGDALAVSIYLGERGVKGAKGAYDWADEHSDDMKRGYLIGADINNWFRYWNPPKVIMNVFRKEKTLPPDDEEFGYSVGVEKAKEYVVRHDEVPPEEQAPVTAATLIGGIAGTLTWIVVHPFVSRHNKKKTREMNYSTLEEAVEDS